MFSGSRIFLRSTKRITTSVPRNSGWHVKVSRSLPTYTSTKAYSQSTAPGFVGDSKEHYDERDGQPWYLKTPGGVPPVARRVFEEYVGLAPDEVLPHIIAVRDKAWSSVPYPCIGSFRFLNFSLPDLPWYAEVVSRIKSGQQYLDFGCCFGHDIRTLVTDGCDPARLHGADINGDFIDLGYELFGDRGTLPTRFYTADVFDPAARLRTELAGRMDVVHAGSFLHLFDWAGQARAAEALLSLMRPAAGSLLVGRQHGSSRPGEYTNYLKGEKQTLYNHDDASFKRFWAELGERRGMKFDVQTEWGTWGKANGLERFYAVKEWEDPSTLRFKFRVEIL